MNLKQMLEIEGLSGLVDSPSFHPERLHLDGYEKTENGYILYTKKATYRVTTRIYPASYFRGKILTPASWVYEAEHKQWWGGFERIKCMTRSEEAKFPKLPSWLGTALVAYRNQVEPLEAVAQ